MHRSIHEFRPRPNSAAGSRARRDGEPAGRAVGRAGEAAAWRFIEFFAATIRNKNTRYAYAEAVSQFFAWCEKHRVYTLEQLKPIRRRLLHREPSWRGAHREAAPGRDQDALRFPGDWPDRTDEPCRISAGTQVRRSSREDAGPDRRPGADAP